VNGNHAAKALLSRKSSDTHRTRGWLGPIGVRTRNRSALCELPYRLRFHVLRNIDEYYIIYPDNKFIDFGHFDPWRWDHCVVSVGSRLCSDVTSYPRRIHAEHDRIP